MFAVGVVPGHVGVRTKNLDEVGDTSEMNGTVGERERRDAGIAICNSHTLHDQQETARCFVSLNISLNH